MLVGDFHIILVVISMQYHMVARRSTWTTSYNLRLHLWIERRFILVELTHSRSKLTQHEQHSFSFDQLFFYGTNYDRWHAHQQCFIDSNFIALKLLKMLINIECALNYVMFVCCAYISKISRYFYYILSYFSIGTLCLTKVASSS